MASSKDIFWVAVPLAIPLRTKANETLSRLETFKQRIPMNEARVFRKVEHWALQIEGKYYEVVPDPSEKFTANKLLAHMCKPQFSNAEDRKAFFKKHKVHPEEKLVGKTTLSHAEIQAEVDLIWTGYNGGRYLLLTQNCQNFVTMLYQRIRASSATETFEKVPDPISYRISDVAYALIGTGVAYGTTGAYIAAVAELSQAANAGAAAATATAATGTGAANTSVHGAVIKGTGGGAMKAGIGAKAAAAMQSAAAGGKVAVVGPAMVKAGGAAAIANPLLAAALASGGAGLILLGYLGRRSGRWSKKHAADQAQIMEDMTVIDALKLEDKLLDPELEEKIAVAMERQAEVESVEDLEENLGLMTVTSEPAVLDEASDAAVVGEDSRRTRTTA